MNPTFPPAGAKGQFAILALGCKVASYVHIIYIMVMDELRLNKQHIKTAHNSTVQLREYQHCFVTKYHLNAVNLQPAFSL